MVKKLEKRENCKLKNKQAVIERINLQLQIRNWMKYLIYYIVVLLGIYEMYLEITVLKVVAFCINICLNKFLCQIQEQYLIKMDDEDVLKKSIGLMKSDFSKIQYLETINLFGLLYATLPIPYSFRALVQVSLIMLYFKSTSVPRKRDLIPRLVIISLGSNSILVFLITILIIVTESSNIGNCTFQSYCIHMTRNRRARKLNKLTFDPSIWEIEFTSKRYQRSVMDHSSGNGAHHQQTSRQSQSQSQYQQTSRSSQFQRMSDNRSSSKDKQNSSIKTHEESQIYSKTSNFQSSSFIINNEQSDIKSDHGSEMRSDQPQVSNGHNAGVFHPDHYDKSLAIREFMLSNISQGVMLCSLKKINYPKSRKSDVCLSLKGVNQRKNAITTSVEFNINEMKKNKNNTVNRQRWNRKIKLFPVQKSALFFQKLPFYREVSQCQNSQVDSKQSIFRSSSNKDYFNTRGNLKYYRSNVYGPLQNKSLFNSGEMSNLSESQKSVSLGMKKMQSTIKEFVVPDMSQLEEDLLEIKIYQPYFISNSTIIQFDRKKKFNVKPEKLSIMDILQAYFIENKNNSSLFFKVNLGDLTDLSLMQNINDDKASRKFSDLLENPNSSISSQNSKLHPDSKVFQKQNTNMEEIKETNSEQVDKASLDKQTKKKHKLKKLLQYKFSQNASIGSRVKEEQKYKRQRKTSQEMNEEISKFFNNCDEPIKPKVRNTSNLQNFQQELIQKVSEEKSSSVSESSCFDEEDLNLNQSIADSDSSTATNADFGDKNISQTKDEIQEEKQELIRYYEFEIKQIDEIKDYQNLTFINIKDITKLVLNQQKFCDIIYQDAIENNFSHEQMTPLNPILNQAVMIKQKLIHLYLEKFGRRPAQVEEDENIDGIHHNDLAIVVRNYPEAKMVIQQLTSVEQAAKLIWYYNTNQIKRMKFKKNQLDIEPSPVDSIEPIIYNVIWPFEHFVFKRRHNIHLIKNLRRGYSMITDWKLYELILFNIFQNSIKYNKNFDGDVVIILTCKPLRKEKRKKTTDSQVQVDHFSSGSKNYVLETQIIDTGIGIQPDRQNLLFIPFLELKDRIGMMKTENDNIGIGLACSREICKKMGGDIKLKLSKKGMTIFSFKLPIQLQKLEEENDVNSLSVANPFEPYTLYETKVIRLIGTNRPIPDNVLEIVEALNIQLKDKNNSSSQQSKDRKSLRSKSPLVTDSQELVKQKYGFQYIENLSAANSLSSNDQRQSRKQVCPPDAIKQVIRRCKAIQKIKNQNSKSEYVDGSNESFLKDHVSKTSKWSQRHEKNSRNYLEYGRLHKGNSEHCVFTDKSQHQSSERQNEEQSSLSLGSQSRHSEEQKNSGGWKSRSKSNGSSSKSGGPSPIQAKLSLRLDTPNTLKEETKNVIEESESIITEQSCSFEFENENPPMPKTINEVSSGGMPLNHEFKFKISESRRSYQIEEIKDSRSKKHKFARPNSDQKIIVKKLIQMNQEEFKQMNRSQKKSLMDVLLVNNHRSKLSRMLSQQNHRELIIDSSSFEIDSEEEVQNIVINDCNKNKIKYGIILPGNSDEDCSHSSEDFIAMMSLEAKPRSENSNVPAVIIRPSDFIVNAEDIANQMRRANDREEIDNQFNADIQSLPLIGQIHSNSSSVSANSHTPCFHINNDRQQSASIPDEIKRFGFDSQFFSVDHQIQAPFPQLIPNDDPMHRKAATIKSCDCVPRILCVDDNDFNLLTLKTMIFNKYEIMAEEAQNGEIAVEMFTKGVQKECKCINRAYKLVFMDIQMPIMDGYEATIEIKKMIDKENQSLKLSQGSAAFSTIVGVTAYTAHDVKEKCLLLGMKKVLQKPVNALQLAQVIDQYYKN